MSMFQHENVFYMHAYRTRQRLIREWKNPLLRLDNQQLVQKKNELAALITAQPLNFELRMKWLLLMEVERG